MSNFVDAEARVLGFEVPAAATAAFTQGGTNRYVFGGVSGADFGGAPTISSLKAGGASGTDLVAALADLVFYGSAARMRVGGLAAGPGPGGTSDVYGAVSGGIQLTVAGAAYDNVHQTTPLNDADDNFGLEGGVDTTTATLAIPNVPNGEKAVAILICASEAFAIRSFVALDTAVIRAEGLGPSGEELFGICVVEKERTGGTTGTVTIQVECHAAPASAGALAWGIAGGWLMSAGGGGSSFYNPLTGRGGAAALPLAA